MKHTLLFYVFFNKSKQEWAKTLMRCNAICSTKTLLENIYESQEVWRGEKHTFTVDWTGERAKCTCNVPIISGAPCVHMASVAGTC
jgi:hypothetical protein